MPQTRGRKTQERKRASTPAYASSIDQGRGGSQDWSRDGSQDSGRSSRQASSSTGSDKGSNASSDPESLGGSLGAGSARSRTSARSRGSLRSPRGKAANRSNNRGLSHTAQKEILEDLEEAGGIKFVLSQTHGIKDLVGQLIDEDEEKQHLYGVDRTSPARVKAVNKIRFWGRLPDQEYKELLEEFGILSAKGRGTFKNPEEVEAIEKKVTKRTRKAKAAPKKTAPKKAEKPPPSFVDVPSSEKETPASSFQVPGAPTVPIPVHTGTRARREQQNIPPTPAPAPFIIRSVPKGGLYRDPKPIIPSSSDEEDQGPVKKQPSKMPTLDPDLPIEDIPVDPHLLEGTSSPFKVTTIKGLVDVKKGAAKLHFGYLVTMKVDPRDALGVPDLDPPLAAFPFKAFIMPGEKNVLIVEAPLVEYSERGGDDEDLRTLLRKREGTLPIMDSLDNARKNFEQRHGLVHDEEEEVHQSEENPYKVPKKYYKLAFSAGVKLSSKELLIHEGKRPGELKLEGMTVYTKLAKVKNRAYSVHKIYWRIADASISLTYLEPLCCQRSDKQLKLRMLCWRDLTIYRVE
ncbi:hypothetical protein SEMRO_1085_G239570.1 [Seminavis robusta]|uniref:Uncharacterized protein n=1 Tax=Seminavis robusta TaxID=568900 RepID=A0A9N8EF01_9STRA|nr:hypothetical protein SEMRO_1085_G239570.1 [Seminavis robusta]|eukprot:Sro1085_g239570.1 n/a (572) ;mRNA; r:6182-7994